MSNLAKQKTSFDFSLIECNSSFSDLVNGLIQLSDIRSDPIKSRQFRQTIALNISEELSNLNTNLGEADHTLEPDNRTGFVETQFLAHYLKNAAQRIYVLAEVADELFSSNVQK